ncbi:MAG TPA: hypothetical protein VNQ33_00675 [Acidimicrobiales bacterium]|nr:hypothetical protein [Acidimicrobiales bacterium]
MVEPEQDPTASIGEDRCQDGTVELIEVLVSEHQPYPETPGLHERIRQIER